MVHYNIEEISDKYLFKLNPKETFSLFRVAGAVARQRRPYHLWHGSCWPAGSQSNDTAFRQ